MEILNLLLDGFAVALQPLNLGLILLGCTVGLFIGAMPGLGSVNGVAILLPLTFLVPPTGAIDLSGRDLLRGDVWRCDIFHHVGYSRRVDSGCDDL